MESKLTDDVGPLAAAASSFPLLVYDYDPPENSQTVVSIADASTRTIRVPELCDYTCLETPQGLVLMVDTVGSCWLWNPQTGEKTALPAMGGELELPHHCRCLISDTTTSPPDRPISSDEDVVAPSSDSDPLVLVYDLARPELLFCRISGNNASWVKQSYSYDIDPHLYEVRGKLGFPTPSAFQEMAAVGDMFFYLDQTKSTDTVGALVVLPAADDDPHQPCLEPVTFHAPLPTPDQLVLTTDDNDVQQIVTRTCYLLESSGELFLVCLFYVGCTLEEVGAYAMDFSGDDDGWRWCRVADIGDAAFLLGPAGFAASCSAAAEHGLKSGCVYLAHDWLGDNIKDVHVFDLKDGTCELVRPALDVPAPLLRKPFWLVPVNLKNQSSER